MGTLPVDDQCNFPSGSLLRSSVNRAGVFAAIESALEFGPLFAKVITATSLRVGGIGSGTRLSSAEMRMVIFCAVSLCVLIAYCGSALCAWSISTFPNGI